MARRRSRAGELEREATARLQADDEARALLLRTVSHELRTPLTIIRGFAEILDAKCAEVPPETARQWLAKIVANCRRLERLVTDLLDLDRLSRGVLEARRHPTDMRTLVAGALEAIDLSGRDVLVEIEREGEVGLVDPAQAERILENLLVNVARHTPPGTPAWIRVREEDGGLLLMVEDAGPGIPDELKEPLFEAFRYSTPEGIPKGTGIGLALVARLAELHRGRAWVEDRPGGGASFRVFLPGWREDLPGVRILVIDWAGVASWVSARALADAGFDVIRCCGPDDPRAVGACPLVERGRCPLVERADAFLVAPTDPTPVFLEVIRTYQALFPSVPMIVVAPPGRLGEYRSLFEGCTFEEGPLTTDRIVKALRDLPIRRKRAPTAAGT